MKNHPYTILQKTQLGFYLPHHAAIKEDSITTKTRVVFDGSAKNSSGMSLNDALMVGPTILNAEIEEMYRQVLGHPDDALYQRILFRENQDESVKEFSLDTVTYGTACVSFLAIRALHQLAEDEKAQHPIAATVLKKYFYVDDLLTGANTRQEPAFLRNDLIALLK